MHAISRIAFLTIGTCFLVLIVLLWAAIHFDVFPLQHISELMAQFSFIGYSIPELLGMGKVGSYRELTYAIKMIFVVAGLFGSISLIGVRFLPSFRLQLKVLSFGLSIPLFVILFNFWIYFISDDRDILRDDKIMLYLFTIIVYSISVFLLWYGLHVRRASALPDTEQEINPMRSHMIQKSIPSADELSQDIATKIQSNQSTEIDVSTLEKDLHKSPEILDTESQGIDKDEGVTGIESPSPELEQVSEATDRATSNNEDISAHEESEDRGERNDKKMDQPTHGQDGERKEDEDF